MDLSLRHVYLELTGLSLVIISAFLKVMWRTYYLFVYVDFAYVKFIDHK